MQKIISLILVTLFMLGLSSCQATQPTEPAVELNTIQEPEDKPLETVQEPQASSTQTNASDTTEEPVSPQNPNEFDLSQAKVGDSVAGMTIAELKLAENKSILPSGSTVSFKGQAQVTGEYQYYGEEEAFLSGNVCLSNFTEDSLEKLPKVIGDQREVWFCFDNSEKAQQELGPQGSTGTATVVIDDYFIITVESEVWNRATLVKLVEKK